MTTSPAMASKIELWALDQLTPYAHNARTHSDDQIARIAASMLEFGVNNPILVDSKGGIVAGHGRLLAARKLDLSSVPVVVLDHLSEAQRRAYILADNRLAELDGVEHLDPGGIPICWPPSWRSWSGILTST